MEKTHVLVDGKQETASGEVGFQTDAEIIIVHTAPTHVWIDDTHYVSVGEVDNSDVSAGDLFLNSIGGIISIEQVLSINHSPENEHIPVEMQFIYNEEDGVTDNHIAEPPYDEASEPPYDEASGTPSRVLEQYTGLENPAMGYTGPPVKLEKVETE